LGDELGVNMRGIITLGEEFHLGDRDVRFVPPLFIRGLDDGLRAAKDAQTVRPYLSNGFPPPRKDREDDLCLSWLLFLVDELHINEIVYKLATSKIK
jgi:hypothetical protein